MKKAGKRTVGMLFDTYILSLVEKSLADSVSYADEEDDDVLNTILDNVSGEDIKRLMPLIIGLAVNRVMISLSRNYILDQVTDADLLVNVNRCNVARVSLVNAIDSHTNKSDLSYYGKTYGNGRVVTMTPEYILLDDLITSEVKGLYSGDSELAERIEAIQEHLVKSADKIEDNVFDLINVIIANMACFFVHEIMLNGEAGGLSAIRAMQEIVMSNGVRKHAMKQMSKSLEE